MSLDYFLELVTDSSVPEVTDRINRFIGGVVRREGEIAGPSVWVSVLAQHDPRMIEVAQESWGLSTNLNTYFRHSSIAPDTERSAAMRNMSIACAHVAVDLDAEAVLHFQGDRALLRRKDGTLYLYDWWREWSKPDVLRQLPQPYELTSDGGP